jgi:hypothetical protein
VNQSSLASPILDPALHIVRNTVQPARTIYHGAPPYSFGLESRQSKQPLRNGSFHLSLVNATSFDVFSKPQRLRAKLAHLKTPSGHKIVVVEKHVAGKDDNELQVARMHLDQKGCITAQSISYTQPHPLRIKFYRNR